MALPGLTRSADESHCHFGQLVGRFWRFIATLLQLWKAGRFYAAYDMYSGRKRVLITRSGESAGHRDLMEYHRAVGMQSQQWTSA
eukprot:3864425-Amphidinium_carterae.1